jgi:hypothetical protein
MGSCYLIVGSCVLQLCKPAGNSTDSTAGLAKLGSLNIAVVNRDWAADSEHGSHQSSGYRRAQGI